MYDEFGADQPKRAGNIGLELSRLNENVEKLEALTSLLADLVDPILLPASIATTAAMPERGEMVDRETRDVRAGVAERLAQLNDRVAGIARRVDNLGARVDL